MKWGASTGPVAGYRIYREGVRIGTTTSLRFVDRVPRRISHPTYFVRAFDQWGNLGPRSRYFTIVIPGT
ncbi:MAG TPA: hypothetical protein VEX62_02150 [Candidatus Limnocylindrales bacterium]|nr:hypothetical protein [Candidatus Limnocylindrales bacterium]